MNQQERRKTNEPFYDAIVDRRERKQEQPANVIPAKPGMIRPLPGEHVQVEHRRFPESGTE